MTPFEAGRTLPAKRLELFFDYSCPYAYVASRAAIPVAERMGVALELRPFLLGAVLRERGLPQNLMGSLAPAKAAHNLADMARAAAEHGLPLVVPKEHPRKTVGALRATLATGVDPEVVAGFFDAYWVEGRDPSAEATISDVVRRAGHDPDAVLRAIATDAVKDALREATARAIARGVFGAPTFVVDDEHLYWGQDRLVFVEGVPARAPASSRAGVGRTFEAFWDYSSPFAYLGMVEAERVAERTGATLVSRPMLLGAVFKAVRQANVPLATFGPERQKHTLRDLERWAAYLGVPYRFPSRFPMSSLKTLRATLLLPEEKRRPFRDAVFRAYWAEDRDISDDAVVAELLGDDAAAILPMIGSPEVKAELARATEQAVARGIFGAPTFVVDGELYWGQDRLGQVERRLVAGSL